MIARWFEFSKRNKPASWLNILKTGIILGVLFSAKLVTISSVLREVVDDIDMMLPDSILFPALFSISIITIGAYIAMREAVITKIR